MDFWVHHSYTHHSTLHDQCRVVTQTEKIFQAAVVMFALHAVLLKIIHDIHKYVMALNKKIYIYTQAHTKVHRVEVYFRLYGLRCRTV